MAVKSVGILGAGQLGTMLADAAQKLELNPVLYQGKLTEEGDISTFLQHAKKIVFENEFVDCDLLERAAQDLEVEYLPPLPVIRLLQDKLSQKLLLTQLGIPTAAFVSSEPGETSEAFVRRALRQFPAGCAFKWSRLGYDGKGVKVTSDVFEASVFCDEPFSREIPVYAEEKVDFRRELAIVACRSVRGEFTTWPLVISEQDVGICKRVYGPATALGISRATETEAQNHAKAVAESSQIVGTFALELFESQKGVLLVNEIAPRVHNSGHYTMNASKASQFENHWRAVLGMPMGSTQSSPAFAMVNLLGPEGVNRSTSDEDAPAAAEGVHVHWYGKSALRPRRKMGHVNAAGTSPDQISSLLSRLKICDDAWVARLKQGSQS